MLDRHLRPLVDPPLQAIAERIAPRISADTVTLCGFGLGCLAVLAVMAGQFVLGLVLLVLNRTADGLDGAVARRNGVTDLGGYLDIVLDFIVYSGVVFGFAVADPAINALPAAFLIFSFMGTGASFLAFAVMAAKHELESPEQGTKSLYYLGGLAEGTETIMFLLAVLLWPTGFPLMAWLFGAVCWLTTCGRILIAMRLLQDR
jgi:phosphatidylglycerophosphate synthase